ncbi:MAG: hypoxanthine phosphoribosyltransferase [Nitrospinota bacterium]|nr:hypoxanthine phosphoribosyltransferase [Nitrospinota bacterium]
MKLEETLFTVEEIRRRVEELSDLIRADYEGRDLHVVTVMKGSLFFTADLIRALRRRVTLGCLIASNYRERTVSEGNVELLTQEMGDVKDRHVLVVDDIVDTGYALEKIREVLLAHEPATLKFAVFLDKVEMREVAFDVDYVGYTIRSKWVVGYGLDCAEQYRELDAIRVIDPAGEENGS